MGDDNSQKQFDFGNFFSDFISNNSNHNNDMSKNNPVYDGYYGEDEEDDGLSKLTEDFNKLKREYDQLKDDFDLYRNRYRNTIKNEIEYNREDFLRDFVSSFVLYMIDIYRSKKEKNTLTEEDVMMLSKINSLLDNYGIEPIKNELMVKFDYNTMEAVCSVEEAGVDSGLVVKIYANGFKMNGKTLVPQKVAVSR